MSTTLNLVPHNYAVFTSHRRCFIFCLSLIRKKLMKIIRSEEGVWSLRVKDWMGISLLDFQKLYRCLKALIWSRSYIPRCGQPHSTLLFVIMQLTTLYIWWFFWCFSLISNSSVGNDWIWGILLKLKSHRYNKFKLKLSKLFTCVKKWFEIIRIFFANEYIHHLFLSAWTWRHTALDYLLAAILHFRENGWKCFSPKRLVRAL